MSCGVKWGITGNPGKFSWSLALESRFFHNVSHALRKIDPGRSIVVSASRWFCFRKRYPFASGVIDCKAFLASVVRGAVLGFLVFVCRIVILLFFRSTSSFFNLAASPVLIPVCISNKTNAGNLRFRALFASVKTRLASSADKNLSLPGFGGMRSIDSTGLAILSPQGPLAILNIRDNNEN